MHFMWKFREVGLMSFIDSTNALFWCLLSAAVKANKTFINNLQKSWLFGDKTVDVKIKSCHQSHLSQYTITTHDTSAETRRHIPDL